MDEVERAISRDRSLARKYRSGFESRGASVVALEAGERQILAIWGSILHRQLRHAAQTEPCRRKFAGMSADEAAACADVLTGQSGFLLLAPSSFPLKDEAQISPAPDHPASPFALFGSTPPVTFRSRCSCLSSWATISQQRCLMTYIASQVINPGSRFAVEDVASCRCR